MLYFSAPLIFTGTAWLKEHVIAVDEGVVMDVLPWQEARHLNVQHHQGLIVPAFVDAQVYGAEGRLFAEYCNAETLHIMNAKFRNEGTLAFLPTLATNSMEVFRQGIDAVRSYWQQGGQGVLGLHLEGPWISMEKRGAHVKQYIHAPEVSEVKELLAYGKDVIRMITLAPEVCSREVIDLILTEGVIISAGHSNAGFQEAMNGFNRGIQTATHLFNAMSGLHHREAGMAGAIFQHPQVKASIIPDGHHVNYEVISIAKKIMGERLFAITDAVTQTETGPYRHRLSTDKYECNGVLSGSALSMNLALKNLVGHAQIPLDEALRMCSLYPAGLLNSKHVSGLISKGSGAAMILLNKDLEYQELLTG